MEFYRRRVFPGLCVLLWCAFLLLDLTGWGDSTALKFLSICLCCFTALLVADSRDARLVAAALCLTVGADWFLLVRNDHYLIGIGLFIPVQLIYAYRLYLHRERPISPLVLLRLFGLGCAIFWGSQGQWVNAFSLFYFLNLCANACEALVLGKPHRAFAWGLLLFVCCDLCVGGWNLGLLPGFTRIGMWFFYLPSQVLIVRSAHRKGGSL